MAKGEIPFEKTKNVLPIIARQETLLLAYKRVKRNRGAMAKGERLRPDANTLETYNGKHIMRNRNSLNIGRGISPTGGALPC
jgi:hypothetical protein